MVNHQKLREPTHSSKKLHKVGAATSEIKDSKSIIPKPMK